MIVIIRMRGEVGVDDAVEGTFQRFGLNRKFSCTLLRETPENMGMARKVENFSAYGQIEKSTLIELIKKRAKSMNMKGKIDAEKIAVELIDGKTDKTLEELGIRKVFRLHPPRKGINIKMHYPKGDLGKHAKINELVMRML